MSVTLALRRIDHQLTVVGGLAAINAAIDADSTDPLVTYISSLPFTPDANLMEISKRRIAKLREVNAPKTIVENECRLQTLIDGTAYSRKALSTKSMDELRELVGQWGWITSTCSLQNTWSDLDWFMQPRKPADPKSPDVPRPIAGDPSQNTLDQVLHGAIQSPHDLNGGAAIATCGSDEPSCFGYNPPSKVLEIDDALQSIDPTDFSDHTDLRREIYREAMPDLDAGTIDDIVAGELKSAQTSFPLVVKFYSKAKDLNRGVACEYSV